MCRAIRLAGALLFCLAGCTPKIGDDCNSSVDCSQLGDRLCDTTQPGGYCTIFNCEPDTCPEDEGPCVAFDYELDPACKSADDAEWARFERTFCMKWCDDDSDCRDGYRCVLPKAEHALIVDTKPHDQQKICLANAPPRPDPSSSIPAVCQPDAGVTLPPPYSPDAGAAGGGGAGTGGGGGAGTGGSGGTGG